jgi:hypothetical protein
MNRVVIQEGYTLPFSGAPKRRRAASKRRRRSYGSMPAAVTRQQSKMKACAKKWNSSGTGKYKNFMSKCLKAR